MRKIISRSLIILNIVLIVALLMVSGILVFFTSSKQTILNHTALLYTDKATTTTTPKTNFILIKKENKAIKKDDKIIYNITRNGSTPIQCVDTVISITDGIVTLKDNVTKIDINTSNYIGKVVFQNHLLGEIFSGISNNKNTTLIYILIFGGVIIIGLSITLVFSIINKNNIKISIENPIEVITEDDNESNELLDDNVLIEEQPITYDSDSINDPQQICMEETMQEFDENTKNNQSELGYKVDEISFSYEIYNEMIFVEETPSKTIQPPTISESASSIDSLLDEIIKQAQDDFYKQQRYNEVTISEIKENENCTL